MNSEERLYLIIKLSCSSSCHRTLLCSRCGCVNGRDVLISAEINTISRRRASTWPTSPRSTNGCAKYDFQVYGHKPCTYLGSILALSLNRDKQASTWHTLTRGTMHKAISMPVVDSSQPCTYLALRLTLSPNGPKWASTWPTSPRCTQIDFHARGTSSANRAPI
jgi:hypothetical protein